MDIYHRGTQSSSSNGINLQANDMVTIQVNIEKNLVAFIKNESTILYFTNGYY